MTDAVCFVFVFCGLVQENQFDIYNEDVADLAGDTEFICADAVSGHASQGSLLGAAWCLDFVFVLCRDFSVVPLASLLVLSHKYALSSWLMMFFCQDGYQWVSRYNLQVWSGWGDYAECNRYTI